MTGDVPRVYVSLVQGGINEPCGKHTKEQVCCDHPLLVCVLLFTILCYLSMREEYASSVLYVCVGPFAVCCFFFFVKFVHM